VRAFVAMRLPTPALDGLAAAGAEVRRRSPAWVGEKWVARDSLHVTLEFLGDRDADELDALAVALTAGPGSLPSFSYSLGTLRAVPSPRRASMLWAVPLEGSPAMERLARAVAEAGLEIGVPVPERPFTTHVTLARARRPLRIDPAALADAWDRTPGVSGKDPGKDPFRNLSGSEVTVFTSMLTRSGPVYETWARVPLGRA
jgi:2'-5' RNA ligase